MVYFCVIASIIGVDFFTKFIVNKQFRPSEKKEIIQEKFYLWHVKNKGIAFNCFEKYPKIVITFTGACIGILLVWLKESFSNRQSSVFKIALSFLIGGASGNFLERVKRGSVTDFLYFQSKYKHMPIFNIADIFIFIGGMILFLDSIFSTDRK